MDTEEIKNEPFKTYVDHSDTGIRAIAKVLLKEIEEYEKRKKAKRETH